MTDQIDQITDTDVEDIDATEGGAGRNKRRMFLTGAGIAGAAAIVGKSGVAEAADGDDVVAGGEVTSSSTTLIDNTGTSGDRSNNAFRGDISNSDNNSHAILGTTVGDGHAIAGVVGTDDSVPDNPVAATWGRSYAEAAATEGQSLNSTAPVGGDANGVKGIIESVDNGSHAVKGVTNGGGHSVAGETPAEVPAPTALDPDATAPNTNTVAATWGKHNGSGAAIGGISLGGYGGEFVGARGSIRLIPADSVDAVDAQDPDDDSKVGELHVDSDGNLQYNSADGNNFSQLNEQTVVFDDSERVFDSREGNTPVTANQGRFTAGETREIDLSDTGVPAGAAANLNVTVTDTGTIGFLTIFDGDTDDDGRPTTSAVTWDRPGTRTSNSTTVRLSDDGTIKVYAESDTEIAIDVSGYNS